MTEKPRKDATLSYAPVQPSPRWQRFFRIAIAVCVACVVGWVAWQTYPEVIRRFSMLYYQHRLLTSAGQGNVVSNFGFREVTVEEVEPASAKQDMGTIESASLVDDDWRHYRATCLSPVSPSLYPVYIHSIYDRHGNELLVVAECMPYASPAQLTVDVISPGTLLQYPSTAQVVVRPFQFDFGVTSLETKSFRVFNGQPDQSDTSHFTIDYEFDGQRHTLDGYINEQDVLTIEKRKDASTNPS
jgi:hypothetical protein